MRATRALAGAAAALLAGACGGSPSPKPIVVRTVATTTTVVTVPATTTTSEAPQRPPRASRSATAPRVAPPAPPPPVRRSADDVPCWLWPEGANRSRARSDECWRPLLERFQDWPISRMLGILYCESHGNPWVTNGKHRNLFQIANATAGDDEEHKLTTAHVELAHAMWVESGTAPWSQCGG